jgi:excisionase family DNA binding protein
MPRQELIGDGTVSDWLTLQEAAQQLDISSRTARRWVKEGRLEAEMRPGPYGPQYFIDPEQIKTAQHITDVVSVERQVDMTTLAQVLNSYLDEREDALTEAITALRTEYAQTLQHHEQQTQALQKEIKELRQQLAARDEQQQRIQAKLLQEIDRQHQETSASLDALAESQSENKRALQSFQEEIGETTRKQEEKHLQIEQRDQEVMEAIRASLERKKRRWPWQR